MQIAFPIAQPNMNCPRLDQENFILSEVFVRWYLVSRKKVFCSQHEMLRPLFLGLTFSMNPPGGGSRHVRCSPSFFSSRSGFGPAPGVEVEPI